jgi:hypothetical protein
MADYLELNKSALPKGGMSQGDISPSRLLRFAHKTSKSAK